jgi:hypothetical protein
MSMTYRADAPGDDVIISDEHEEYRWVTGEQFRALPSTPKVERFTESALEGRDV